jgi:hypothetical protein
MKIDLLTFSLKKTIIFRWVAVPVARVTGWRVLLAYRQRSDSN